MNSFDEWSQIISKCLKSEADFLTTVAKHEIEIDAPRETFIRNLLELFLPGSYAIGSGRVVDSEGQSSNKLDLVIYRRDFPRLNLPGSTDTFLHESVLASVEVRPKLVRKTLFDALDACASLSELNPAISEAALATLAEKNGLARNPKGLYVHEDPLLTARFNLVGRPPSFIYGFNGFKTSFTQLAENIEVWIEDRREKNLNLEMKSFPAIIATQGVFGCRNAAPLSAKRNHLFGIGVDDAPIRLIVLHLLYALNRRLKITSDGSGLRPGLDAYLMKMVPPDIQYTTGRATNVVIRTAAITEEVVDDSVEEESIEEISVEAVAEPIAAAAVVEEEVADSIQENDPIAEPQTPDLESVEAVFETIPTPAANPADAELEIEATSVATTTEDSSFDPFDELEADASGTEAQFIETSPDNSVVDEEGSENSDSSDVEEEFAGTVEMSTDEFDVEEDFAKTVVVPPPKNAKPEAKDKKPVFEQDFVSTPATPNPPNSN